MVNCLLLFVVESFQTHSLFFCFRLLRTQSLDWYYNNVKSRFKCFGSAKVLKNLYKKHRLESGVCPDVVGKNSCVDFLVAYLL